MPQEPYGPVPWRSDAAGPGKTPTTAAGSAFHADASPVGSVSSASSTIAPAPAPGSPSHLPSASPTGSATAAPALAPLFQAGGSDSPFGASLAPVLCEACQGRLTDLHWFRTTWQRGGALTGYARYRGDDGQDHPVVAKLPVAPRERNWLIFLQDAGGIVPHMYAHGETLGGYDMAWIVMERLPHGPLGAAWTGSEFDLLVEAAGRFYSAVRSRPVHEAPPEKNWNDIFHTARHTLQHVNWHDSQRWKNAFKAAHRKLNHWLSVWNSRSTDQWCHGDLHLGNALSRNPAPQGPAVLIDFAEVHAGNWIEDAVYFEHLFWARKQRLGGRRLCSQMAHERRTRGLSVDPEWPKLASIRRALLALSTPAMLQHDGDPHHVHAALEVLETEAGVS